MNNFETFFPKDLSLQSSQVLLRPMLLSDEDAFFSIAQHPELWKYFTKELMYRQQLQEWMADAFTMYQQQIRFPFTVIQKATGKVAGSTSLGNISFIDKRVEIGWTWYGNDFRSTGINTHCKFLLLQYAFEHLQFERVEIKTDFLNERSKAALKKIGASFEGVLRSHMQMPHGRRRDTAYFSILKNEWPYIKQTVFANIH